MAGFVDEAQLHARAGDGGAGSTAFRREAHVDRGGPDGGDGGRGGDVWLEASRNQSSLLGFRDHPFRRATDGGHGSGGRRHGARGVDTVVPVPVGTVVHDRAGTLVCDLSGAGDRWLAAEGGRGGRGNAKFLSNTRRAPAFAEQGERGVEQWYDLELKLVADVALVGFPNVGKSTLISVVSAAKPKIADYPFTTLQPNLGVVRVSEDREFVMADVPGLVEGAADGRGLGHRFLRHVERSRVLLVVLDLAAADGTTPRQQLAVLERELEAYQPSLLERPRLVVGSKADLVPAPDGDDVGLQDGGQKDGGQKDGGQKDGGQKDAGQKDGGQIEGGGSVGGESVGGGSEGDGVEGDGVEWYISAVTRQGLRELVFRLADLVDGARAEEATQVQGEIVIHRPAPEGVAVVRVDARVWQLEGREAERAVAFSDMNDQGALDEAVRRLRRLGVDRALSRAGAHDGDIVHVGDTSFTWYRDGHAAALDAIRPALDGADDGGDGRRKGGHTRGSRTS